MIRVQSGSEALRAHVEALAGTIGERNVFRPRALADAADFIAREWRRPGYEVAPQTYDCQGLPCANLEIARRGTRRPEEIVLVGAHYDSVRFVAFVNEEPPLYFTRDMGSDVYARAARARGDDIRLMISLETIGYYSEAAGSQHYPPFFRFFFPGRGDFVAFVSNLRSRRLLRRAVQAFRAGSDFPVEHLATPGLVPGAAWSDHRSFWRQGYRALMVTDTAFYRYPHYHSPDDTPDKLDYGALARLTEGLANAVETLAAEE